MFTKVRVNEKTKTIKINTIMVSSQRIPNRLLLRIVIIPVLVMLSMRRHQCPDTHTIIWRFRASMQFQRVTCKLR